MERETPLFREKSGSDQPSFERLRQLENGSINLLEKSTLQENALHLRCQSFMRLRDWLRTKDDRGRKRNRALAAGGDTGGAEWGGRTNALLADIGRFRVVREEHLREVHFAGNRRACSRLLDRMREQGLIEVHRLYRKQSGNRIESTRLLSLTRRGKFLVQKQPAMRHEVFYSRMVRPREAIHDSWLYPVCRFHTRSLELQGARIVRIRLDYELKKQYWREYSRRRKAAGDVSGESIQAGLAHEMGLALDGKRVQFPDARIEYEHPDLGIAHVNIELTTDSYRRQHMAQKSRAGFTLYAAPGGHFHRGGVVWDDPDLPGKILSF